MSSSFYDGPAKGCHLELRRTPVFLRVVIDQQGEVDALDQLDDEAREGETVHVYHLKEKPATAFVCSRGRGGSSCRGVRIATYHFYPTQPSQDLLRDNEAWGRWVMEEIEEKRRGTDHQD